LSIKYTGLCPAFDFLKKITPCARLDVNYEEAARNAAIIGTIGAEATYVERGSMSQQSNRLKARIYMKRLMR